MATRFPIAEPPLSHHCIGMTVFHQDDPYAGQRRLINLDGNHRITAIMRINSTAACTPIHEIPRVKIVQPLPGVSVCGLLYCNLIFLQELEHSHTYTMMR